jgi:catechol 2,3-dioxygenase-like lactoylglutathione lyase family enzyme
MLFGAHVVVYSQDEAADRAFFRDILGFASVDAGHGWLAEGKSVSTSRDIQMHWPASRAETIIGE